MAKNLSIKELKFCSEYAIDENGSRSAIAAGYAPNSAAVTASRLLKKANVREEIDRLTAKTLGKLEITREYVLKNIMEVGEKCLQRFPVMVGQGKDRVQATEEVIDPVTGEEVLANVWQFDAGNVLKAQELLGKHLKLFTDKVEATGENGGPLQVIVKRIGFDAKS